MSVYGDYVTTTTVHDLDDVVNLLAAQARETFQQLYPDGKWPEGIVAATVAWKLCELTEIDAGAAANYFENVPEAS